MSGMSGFCRSIEAAGNQYCLFGARLRAGRPLSLTSTTGNANSDRPIPSNAIRAPGCGVHSGRQLDSGEEALAGRKTLSQLNVLVDLVRFELTTSSMPWKRAPNCATGPLPELLYYTISCWFRYHGRNGKRRSLETTMRVHTIRQLAPARTGRGDLCGGIFEEVRRERNQVGRYRAAARF